jgi:uncharacterized protein YqhQ
MKPKEKDLAVGGQAVIEGVMMRSGKKISTAIRKDDKIIVKKEDYVSITKRYKFLGLPFIRGVISLFEMMYIGMRTLMWSAQENSFEEGEKLSNWQIALTVVLSLIFSIALFKFLPYLFTNLLGFREVQQPIFFNIIDGIIKIIILVSYLFLISRMNDIKRVFQYHGAEHKAVNAYESGSELTPKKVKKFSRIHPRCGTNFILNVFLIGVIIFSIVPVIVQNLFSGFSEMGNLLRFSILFSARILMLPVIAGISYEWLKMGGKFKNQKFMNILNAPGLLIQRITTREPTLDQIEVACAALSSAIEDNPKESSI